MSDEADATPFPDGRCSPPSSGAPGHADQTPSHPEVRVWKFGGTSVSDQTRLKAVAERMVEAHRHGHRVVAVLSAMGSSTTELADRAHAMTVEPSLRELDALLSVGESTSCALAAMAVHDLGAPAVSLNAVQVGMETDGRHANATLHHVDAQRIHSELDRGSIVLVTGFQGVSRTGDLTTLGRGGSDASAVAIAAALGLGQCEIFSDVRGVFTADPRVVPHARPLASLRHEEMQELAEGGSGVLQPRAVELATTHDVDIHLRSSFTHDEGTWIRREPSAFESADVAGVAHRARERLYTACGISPADVAAALAQRGAAVGAMRSQESDVCFSVPGTDDAEVAAAIDAAGGSLKVHEDLGSVSVVSTGIGRKPEITADVLVSLEKAGIAPRLTTTTSGRVCVHVDSDRVDEAVRRLHDVFIEAGPGQGPERLATDMASVAARRVCRGNSAGTRTVDTQPAEGAR